MKTRICIFLVMGMVLMSACTRPYSTAPFPENLLPGISQDTPAPQVNPSQVGAETPLLLVPTAPGSTSESGVEPAGETAFRALFIPQSGTPVWMGNSLHPEAGCNWMGIAGQVFDIQSTPIKDLVLTVGGELNGELVNRVGLTGIAPQYGEGGYEVRLADRPIASSQTLWVQILDLQGRPLTDKIYFDTLDDCERNLVLINFVQASTGEVSNYFLPIVSK